LLERKEAMKDMIDALDQIMDLQEEEEVDTQELYCAACKKKFRSEKQWKKS